MSFKCRNVLGPSTLIECGGCNKKYFYALLLMDAPFKSTTTTIVQVCRMLVVVQDFFHVDG
jgi:hypothetical protein